MSSGSWGGQGQRRLPEHGGLSPTKSREPGHNRFITGKTFPLAALKENFGLASLMPPQLKQNGARRGDCSNLQLIQLASPGNKISLSLKYNVWPYGYWFTEQIFVEHQEVKTHATIKSRLALGLSYNSPFNPSTRKPHKGQDFSSALFPGLEDSIALQ